MNPLLWPALFLLNLLCKRQMKRAGWTDDEMAELQRRMLGETEQRVEVLEAAE